MRTVKMPTTIDLALRALVFGAVLLTPMDGSVLSSAGTGASMFGYTGEVTDNTGLVYLRARYLSTSIGRFISKDVWPGNYHRPQSLNPWQYVEGKPINLADPSGRIPRLGGVCPNPSGNPYEEVPPYAPGDLIDRRNRMYIYCGEFALTAYQFISREDQYDSSQTRVALGTSYSPSALFVEDVRLNGTGRTASPAFLPVCFGGYFTNVQYTTGPNSEPAFRFDCRKGKEYNVAPYPLGDMYRAAADDLVRLKLNSEVDLPEMCGEGRPCTGSYNPDLVIRDTGNAIRGLRLDIFAGEGPGLRSRDLNQSPSVAWGGQHRYLGITITWDGRSAIGPTPGYQRVPTEYEQFYRALYCDNTAPPGGPR
jgi:RHS repeat-associated protein